MADQKAYQELKSRLSDQHWRLNNLYKIIDQDGEKVTFRMNAEQEHFYRNMWHFNCILKARQLGFSTVIQIYGLDCALFNSNYEFGVIAQTRDDASSIFKKKIKFAYDNLPAWLKATRPATNDSANELSFSNGSSIRVGTSLRSSTLQLLHVSEFGKIAAKYPEKAEEIKTGAFNTVHANQIIAVESTAEGVGGEFHDLTKRAERLQQQDSDLTALDPKFFFYPWWRKASYRLPDTGVSIHPELKSYFQRLEDGHGIVLDDEQKAWYVKKAEQQGDAMKREFPSTPAEPFEVAVEGAYFANEMARVRKEGRICRIPIETSVPVNTFWDLGRNDSNAIWLHQRVGKEDRFIGYYQNSGEGLSHYVAWLKDWLPQDTSFGVHYLPHDAEVVELTRSDHKSRKEVIEDMGLRPCKVVTRVPDLNTGIQSARDSFPRCWFDEERCKEGIDCLDGYRKRWNETTATWADQPLKNKFIHGADAFRQFGQGYHGPKPKPKRKIKTDWVL